MLYADGRLQININTQTNTNICVETINQLKPRYIGIIRAISIHTVANCLDLSLIEPLFCQL